MKQLYHNSHFWLIVGIFVIDGLFFSLADPSRVPSPLLIVGFCLLLTTVYIIAGGLLRAARWYGLKIAHPKRLARLTVMFAGAMIALQSIGALGRRDVMVLLPLVLLSYLYVSYTRQTAGE